MPYTQKDFTTLHGTSLVEAFNAMAASKEGIALGAKPVTRFSDTKTGVKRCETLASSIRAHREGQKAEAERDKKKPTTKTAKEKPEPKKHETQFGKVTQGSNRDKLLARLLEAQGDYLSRNDLMVVVYGVADKDHRGRLAMVLKGLGQLIASRKLGYKLETRKEGKDTLVALKAS